MKNDSSQSCFTIYLSQFIYLLDFHQKKTSSAPRDSFTDDQAHIQQGSVCVWWRNHWPRPTTCASVWIARGLPSQWNGLFLARLFCESSHRPFQIQPLLLLWAEREKLICQESIIKTEALSYSAMVRAFLQTELFLALFRFAWIALSRPLGINQWRKARSRRTGALDWFGRIMPKSENNSLKIQQWKLSTLFICSVVQFITFLFSHFVLYFSMIRSFFSSCSRIVCFHSSECWKSKNHF